MMGNKTDKGKKNISFDIKKNWQALVLLILLVSEFAFIIWLNLFHISDTIDEDFSGMLTHALEMAAQKKLLLPNWYYPTTGEFDTSLFLAVPLILITGNVYISFAIVNILNAALIGYVMARVLRIAGARTEYMIIGMCMALASYDFGMLDYTNMLFFGGSQYVYKAVLPLLFLAVIFYGGGAKDSLHILDMCLFYALFFLTSFSSGIYVFLCGIISILVSVFVLSVCGSYEAKKPFVIHGAATSLTALVGVFLHGISNLEMHSFNSDLMKLRHGMTFTEAFDEVLDSFVMVVDPVAKDLVDATSFIGISGAMKWMMLFLVCLGLAFVPKAFGFEAMSEKGKKTGTRESMAICMVSVFLFNFIILIVTVSKSRYHLIGFFALMFCSVIFVEDHLRLNGLLEKAVLIFIAVMYACLEIANITWHAPMYFAKKNLESYYLDEKFCERVKECAEENDVSYVFFSNVVEDAEIMRLYDKTHNYQTYVGRTGEVHTYDSYITGTDKSRLADRNLLLVTEEGYSSLRSYITDYYEKIDHIGKYDVFISEYSPMDGGSFVIKGETTVDLPISPGYEYVGDVGIAGYLFSASTGKILESPDIEAEVPFTYILNYDYESTGDGEASLEIYRNKELYDTRPIDAGSHSISVELPGRSTYRFTINKEGDGILTIREIEFKG